MAGPSTPFELIDELPPRGEVIWYYPGATQGHGKDGMLLRLTGPDRGAWLAMVAGVRFGPIAMPQAGRVFACGLVLNVDDPADWYAIELNPFYDVAWSADRSIVLFSDHFCIEAFGTLGKLWMSPVIPYDGLTITLCDALSVYCRGYRLDPLTDDEEWFDIVLDARSGEISDVKPSGRPV